MDIMEDNRFEMKIRHKDKMSRNYFMKIMAWNNS